MIEKYKNWLEMQRWLDVLNELRQSELGFSFNECVPKPVIELKATGGYLRKMQESEQQYVEKAYAEYCEKYAIYEKGLPEYKQIGKEFYMDMTDNSMSIAELVQLMEFSEECDHLFHNAAVLWLEEHELELQTEHRADYEEVLKILWFTHLLFSMPDFDWFDLGAWSERQKALAKYLLGRDAVDWWNVPFDDEVAVLSKTRQLSHVTLGKVLLRRKTRFHGDERIRAHPGFWGLFLISPYNDSDRGYFTPGPRDQDTTAWIDLLTNAPYKNEENPNFFRNGDTGFQFYERVPRLFLSEQTLPGFYFHRSKAHGRDDFLALVSDDKTFGRQTMLACTKGVGADPNLIPDSTVSSNINLEKFKQAFNNKINVSWSIPIAYPDLAEKAKDSWANVGFCAAMGKFNEEMITTDFEHFGELSEAVTAEPLLPGLDRGIVEPYTCIEISRFRSNFKRLPENLIRIGFGIEDDPQGQIKLSPDRALIGFPVQVVTVAPCETSLRLYKRAASDKQNYDYDCPALELNEWERCYRDLIIPGEQDVLLRMNEDLARLGSFHLRVLVWNSGISRATNLRQLNEYIESNRAEVEKVFGPFVRDWLEIVRRKMLVMFRILHGVTAAYAAFLNLDWASDTYTGSFSGRNYNSGPRDSNEWGALIRSSAKSDCTGPAGGGPFCGNIDATQFKDLIGIGGDLVGVFDMKLVSREPEPADWETGVPLWPGLVLHDYLTSLDGIMLAANNDLKRLWGIYTAPLMSMADSEFDDWNALISSEYRAFLRKNTILPGSLRDIFSRLKS